MNPIVENLTGMNNMTDQVIAADLLNAAKSAIKNCAWAIAETTTPQVRDTLRRQLDDAITAHTQVSSYMINKGYYHTHNIDEQIKLDLQNAQKVMNLPG